VAAGQWIAAAVLAAAALVWSAAPALARLSRLPATLRGALLEAMDRLEVKATLVSEDA